MLRSAAAVDLGRDLSHAARSLLRAPLLATTIALTVGVGIGAATAMFSAVYTAFLRPLPYAEPERLVWIYTDDPPFEFRFSAVDYLALQSQQTQFASVAGFTNRTLTFNDGTAAEVLRGRAVTWTYFHTLGITPIVGRDFAEADGQPGSAPVVMLGHAFWRDRLAARQDVVGRSIRLDGVDHLVVGILPARIGPLEARQDVYVAAQISPPTRKGPFLYWVVGRLKPEVSRESAAAELRTINTRIFPLWLSSYQNDRASWALMDLKDRLVGASTPTAALLLSAVGLVWLLACVNAANLLVGRIAARRRDLETRLALGASRGRILRLLLTESTLLACASAAIGLAVAIACLGLIRGTGAEYLARTHEVAFDWVTAAVFVAAVFLSAALFGAIPAVQSVSVSRGAVRPDGDRTATGSRTLTRFRRLLVGTQFAVSTPLLVVAVLLFNSLDALRRVDLGIRTDGVITGSLRLPGAAYQDTARIGTYWEALQPRLAAVPGVAGAAFADSLPTEAGSNINNFDLEQHPTPPGQAQPATAWVSTSPEYFDLLGIRLLEGRLLDIRDARTENLESIVVDRTWAARFFPGETAVGKRLREGGCTECPWTSVVGVVSDVTTVGLDVQRQGTVYAPIVGRLSRYVILRTDGDPRPVMSSLRAAIRDQDPDVALTSVATIDQLIEHAIDRPAILARLLVSFAIVAVVLAFTGILGVMGHYVQQNGKEISIRVALGGSPARIIALLARQAVLMIAGGALVGLPLAYGAASMTASLLFSVTPVHASTYLQVMAIVLVVGAAACIVPVLRALRLEPAALLRN